MAVPRLVDDCYVAGPDWAGAQGMCVLGAPTKSRSAVQTGIIKACTKTSAGAVSEGRLNQFSHDLARRSSSGEALITSDVSQISSNGSGSRPRGSMCAHSSFLFFFLCVCVFFF